MKTCKYKIDTLVCTTMMSDKSPDYCPVHDLENQREYFKKWLDKNEVSIRSIAKRLGLSASYVSDVLREKRNMTLKLSEKIKSLTP